jgi:hypothetical protein
LVDPLTGGDWYTNATILEKIRQTIPTPPSGPLGPPVPTLPYFDHIFPANFASVMGAFEGMPIPASWTPTQALYAIMANGYQNNDWTDVQADIDTQRRGVGLPPLFFQSQFGALNAWSTVANSNYHGLIVSVRQRFHNNLLWDFNYTYSHSLDDASGLQNAGGFSSAAFIENPLRQRQSYANSAFDVRHLINFNAVYHLPFGRGQMLGRNANRAVDAIIGGWQLSSIFRWNSGLPFSGPFDSGAWVTNFNLSAQTSLASPQPASGCVSRLTVQFFGCNNTAAFQSFRNAYPGETGARNTFRAPGYIALDGGLFKEFNLGWAHLGESTKIQLRWEVFNVTNTQHFGFPGNLAWPSPSSLPATPTSNFMTFSSIQGSPRVMQVGIRLEF